MVEVAGGCGSTCVASLGHLQGLQQAVDGSVRHHLSDLMGFVEELPGSGESGPSALWSDAGRLQCDVCSDGAAAEVTLELFAFATSAGVRLLPILAWPALGDSSHIEEEDLASLFRMASSHAGA